MSSMDMGQVLTEIEDHVVPRLKLDVGEARLYCHLLRHSRLIEKHDGSISIQQLADVLNCSKNTIKPRLRSLQDKKVIDVAGTGWTGTRIKVFLPREIPNAVPEQTAPEQLDIEEIDFFKDDKYRPAILERERGLCFYCRRVLTDDDAGLDHAEPQNARGTNSYRNVVAACHSCNSSKGDDTAEEFLRKIYRRGILDMAELETHLADVVKLKQGLLRPII